MEKASNVDNNEIRREALKILRREIKEDGVWQCI